MLNRSETVERLIRIRVSATNDDIQPELEKLIKDLIGLMDSERNKLINKILSKAYSGEITTEMAMVAIHEVVLAEKQAIS